jgi:hypothetical protein
VLNYQYIYPKGKLRLNPLFGVSIQALQELNMELKADSRAESGFPQGTLLPNIRSPGPDKALRSTFDDYLDLYFKVRLHVSERTATRTVLIRLLFRLAGLSC